VVKTEIAKILERALDRCAKDGLLPSERPPVQLDAPKNPAHGDFSCNAAMMLQKQHAQATGAAKPNPRALAQAIVDRIEDPDGAVEKVEIAGPGFLNLRVAKRLFFRELGAVWREKDRFGHTDTAQGRKTMVEFVSANPTGPMHVGHGRGAVIGDTVARLLEWSGHDVFREFYVNDAGGQEIDGSVPLEPLHPDDYQGEYVKDVARTWLSQKPDLRKPFEELKEPLRKFATGWMLENLIKKDLELFGIRFDSFFSEKTLHDQDRLNQAVAFLTQKGLVAEELLPPPKGVDIDEDEYVPVPLKVVKTTRYGDERDRPLFKTNGEPTYFAADIAYHFDKIDRGYQRLVNVWGADHGGYIPRMKAAVKAMGGELEIILFQLVNLMKDGQPYRMSKRAANFVTLRELLETAGPDATRVFFLLRRGDMALDFDIGLAQKRDLDNPVFYVQYGHARCRAILRKAKEDRGLEAAYDAGALSALELPEELDLVKRILAFPELVASAAQSLEPHRLVFYLQETIAAFHGYYTKYKKSERVISDDARKTAARLYLVWALAQTLHNALEGILGVTAPERMDEPPGESESG